MRGAPGNPPGAASAQVYHAAMSTIAKPVGPQPASVYWRRRLVLLFGLIAVIAVVVLIVVRPGAATGDGAAPGGTGAGGSGETSSTGDGSGAGDSCDPDQVTLGAVTDATTYGPEQQPLLSMSITNSGSTPCRFDVGTAGMEYVITSGSDRIWSSKDCQSDPVNDVRELEPGVTLTTAPIPWDRTRSSVDTCAGERPGAGAGGASYHLRVSLGEAEAADTRQFVLAG